MKMEVIGIMEKPGEFWRFEGEKLIKENA